MHLHYCTWEKNFKEMQKKLGEWLMKLITTNGSCAQESVRTDPNLNSYVSLLVMHIHLLLVLKFMTVMDSLQELFSAEIHGESMNGKETGVITLENGQSNPKKKSDLFKKKMELFGFNLINFSNALEK